VGLTRFARVTGTQTALLEIIFSGVMMTGEESSKKFFMTVKVQ
jgi:hypothetical protein